MNIIQAMKERRSVRSYNGQPLSDTDRDSLSTAVNEAWSPFGGSVTIRLKQFNIKEFRPGTYGMIKNAVDYFMLGIGSSEESALTAGFKFEQVVLRAWMLGLGTCWIAATFRDSDFERGETWPEGETLRIVCPVGTPSAEKSLRERIARLAIGSGRRKRFGELFFDRDFDHPLSTTSRYAEALDMLRLAPSSTNSQPWRALVMDDTVHFYYEPKSPASVLDCGIGLCHFVETERFHGRQGAFVKTPEAPAPVGRLRYLVSYTAI